MIPQKTHRLREGTEGYPLANGKLSIFLPGSHFLLGATVENGHPGRSQLAGHNRPIDGRISPPDDNHLIAHGDFTIPLFEQSQIHLLQKVQGLDHPG
jgi:hypothetical protein